MRRANYSKVFDERKRRVRGLWKRNGWFYARLSAVDDLTGRKATRRVRLETARTALHDLHKDRRDHTLPVLRRSPRLDDYWGKYFTFHETVKDTKRGSTLRREKSARRNWLGHLGEIRLNEIKRFHLNGYLAKRQAAGTSPRTVNREMIALRNVLKRAVDDDLLKTLPMENLRPLPVDQRKRPLVTPEQCNSFLCLRISNPVDQSYVKSLLPDSVRGITSMFSTLRRGECILLGDSVMMPTRIKIDRPNPQPQSDDASFYKAWNEAPKDVDFAKVLHSWRNQEVTT